MQASMGSVSTSKTLVKSDVLGNFSNNWVTPWVTFVINLQTQVHESEPVALLADFSHSVHKTQLQAMRDQLYTLTTGPDLITWT